MRIAPEALLDLQCKRVHATPHVGDATRNPDLHARGKRDHCRSTTDKIRASASGSTTMGTISRRPLGRAISTCECRERSGGSTGPGWEAVISFVTVTGVKDTGRDAPSSPLPYCRRQIVNSDRHMPC